MNRLRRAPRWLRALAPLLLVVTSCHSIDEDAFAHGPVPLADLPFHEPVSYSVGASAGLPVASVNGLLASYFSGAAFVQPGHNEQLDYQQIDAQVDFIWDASDTNPVIASPAGIDHNDGDFRLPDHWPIWSVVWEGYLDAPSTGTYGLRIHVNNGGWLQMKGEAGLATVIDCAGGTSFEGDCDATKTLETGRHYIRISYYNNSPPVAAAIFAWQPPGAADFETVPSSRLFTQAEAPTIKRGFIFVHGIKGNFTTPGFDLLMDRVRNRYKTAGGEPAVAAFQYHQDVGNLDGGRCTDRPLVQVLPYDDTVGYPVDFPVIGEPDHCDSNDDIGVDGLFLEFDIKRFQQQWGVDKITLVSNSMGGAIVRAYLAYAAATKDRPGKIDTLEIVDGVVFLQGVQQGAYPLVVKEFFDEHPVLQPIRDELAKVARERIQIDPDRPAATDLAPRSAMINYVNRLEHVPRAPSYANVRSDIRLKPVNLLLPWKFPLPEPFSVGDYLLLPGDDNPTRTPVLGGAGILPSTVAAGASSGQWTLAREDTVIVNPPLFPLQIPFLISAPETHFQLGAKMNEICVRTLHGVQRLDQALFDLITALDVTRPDLSYLDFGDMPNVACP